MNGACQVNAAEPSWAKELKVLGAFAAVFLLIFFLPVGIPRFDNALKEGLGLTKWYAQEHVLLCLIPALFIAGAISTFVNQASVMRYLGPKANKAMAYGMASISGTILAVCSCTVLPLFGGIWMRGAGLGPASAFLYSGPAINVLAIIMTARILGMELGIARAMGAVAFSVVIGLAMHFVFRREEQAKAQAAAGMPEVEATRPLWQTTLFFASMVGLLVFANWSKPAEMTGLWAAIHAWKWPISGGFSVGLGVALGLWFEFKWTELALAALPVAILSYAFPHEPLIPFIAGCGGLAVLCARHTGEGHEWLETTWTLAKQIFPLLIGGVFVSGLLLGRPGHDALIPSEWVSQSVGGNTLAANAFASVVGAFMYFATLTEVPILQGLLGSGMGKGPALALLLAGPALSLPSVLVLRSIMGTRKVVVYVALVIVMATATGLIYGTLFG
jgi:uncharacterized membrane protein YraQ (UPF0718 family)